MFMVESILIQREQLDTTRARAHQYWHVIAQLCTEMSIRKSEKGTYTAMAATEIIAKLKSVVKEMK